MDYKKLTYAYYSSPNAIEYNKGLACWIVDDTVSVIIFQDHERFEALKCFEAIDMLPHPIESFTRQSLPFQAIVN